MGPFVELIYIRRRSQIFILTAGVSLVTPNLEEYAASVPQYLRITMIWGPIRSIHLILSYLI